MMPATAFAGPQRANLLVRLLVGLVFLPEGFKKFLFPEQWGAGRFARIGIAAPELMAHLWARWRSSAALCYSWAS